jgi:heptose I phosphotransferase
MTCPGDLQITRKRGRTVVTLAAGGTTFYLKRHAPISLWAALLRRIHGEHHLSSAGMEWRAIRAVEALGIPSVTPVAMGEHLRFGGWERGSFILTAELPNGIALEKLLPTRPALSAPARRRLTRRIAVMARRLHHAGYVHCDFYLGHIYVVGDLEGEYRLHLLDVQRLHEGARIGNRWSVKDISALYFSSLPLACISNADRLRFVLAYLDEPRVNKRVRRFIAQLTKKARRTARHTEKLLARRRRRGELPPLPPPVLTAT